MELNRVKQLDRMKRIENVLLSVSDKTGLQDFVLGLKQINPSIKIYSTGGTYKAIREILGEVFKENLIAVTDYTGQPEMQGGLVKTLDFKIYLGLLSETYNESHQKDLERLSAINFDMVVVNLYPFKKTIEKSGVTVEDARTNIDIGGPCMLRASAKNFLRVASVCNPLDYSELLTELKENQGQISLETRFRLAKASFKHTAEYDKAISGFFESLDSEAAFSIYDLM